MPPTHVAVAAHRCVAQRQAATGACRCVEGRSAAQDDCGAFIDGFAVGSASFCASDNDLLEQPVHQLPCFLDGEVVPGVEESGVGDVGGDAAFVASFVEGVAGGVEGVLSCFGALDEALFAEQGVVVDEQFEFVFGVGFDRCECLGLDVSVEFGGCFGGAGGAEVGEAYLAVALVDGAVLTGSLLKTCQ